MIFNTVKSIMNSHGHYPTVEESFAFIFFSNTKGLVEFTVSDTVFHVVSSHQGSIESHARCARPWDTYVAFIQKWLEQLSLGPLLPRSLA